MRLIGSCYELQRNETDFKRLRGWRARFRRQPRCRETCAGLRIMPGGSGEPAIVVLGDPEWRIAIRGAVSPEKKGEGSGSCGKSRAETHILRLALGERFCSGAGGVCRGVFG